MKYAYTAILLVGILACGQKSHSVRIALPLPPKLDLTEYDYIYFPGFISDVQNDDFDTGLEALNFFKREFTRREIMSVVDKPPVDLSDKDPRTFFDREQPFFKTLNMDHPDRTLALTGVISFDILDRSGFQQVKNTDALGRVYYKTEFVEITGYNLNMRVFVYDMEGRILYRELLKDTVDVAGNPSDARLVYYELLQRMSDRILGLFTNTTIKQDRSLL
jgi:hypothetical protein